MSEPSVKEAPPPASGAAGPAGGGWQTSPHKSLLTAARLVSFSVVCGLLFWGKVVAIPFALAVLFSFMLHPLVTRLQRAGLRRAAAVAVTLSLACGVVISLTWIIGSQLVSLGQKLPEYQDNITAKVKQVRSMVRGGAVEKIQDTMESVAQELDTDPAAAGKEAPAKVHAVEEKPKPVYLTTPQKLLDFEALSKLMPVLDPLVTAGLVFLLIFLLLFRWEDMRNRLLSFSGHKNLTFATRACDDAGKRIIRYLMMQLLVNGSYGLTIGAGLYLLGVDYAALWALCAALFRYVPYAGPIVGALLPIGFSFITSDGLTQPLWVACFIVALELVSNNVIEPWLYGSSLGLSAMGVIMSAVAWTFLWGPVGLVMSTPLTVCLVVLGEYVPAFSIFTRLLGDKPVMEPHFQFYQRLLARDETEATDLAKEFVKENSLRESADRLFGPALALADRDNTAGLLEKEDPAWISAAASRLFEQVCEESDDGDAKDGEAPAPAVKMKPVPIVVWPMNEFALSAGKILQWLLRDSTAEVILLPPQMLAGEIAQEIRDKQPAAVCLLSLAGSDIPRTRSFTKRLGSEFSSLPLIVARLGVPGTLAPSARKTFVESGAINVTRTLTETGSALLPYASDAAGLPTEGPNRRGTGGAAESSAPGVPAPTSC